MLARIGEVEVWRVLESVGPLMPLRRFFPDVTAEMLEAHADAILPGSLLNDPGDGKLWLVIPVQAFLLRTPRNLILVDACVGNDKALPSMRQWEDMKGTRVLASLDAAGAGPEDVDFVLCTHLHMDHVGWTTQLRDGSWVPTFPNAQVLAGAADIEMAREIRATAGPETSGYWVWEQTVGPLLAANRLRAVAPDEEIDPAIRLMPTPGHTPGHLSVEILAGRASGGLVTGDTLHFSLQCALPHLCPTADRDPARATESRRWMLAHLAETGALAFGSHIPLPSAGRIEPKGDGFLWRPVI